MALKTEPGNSEARDEFLRVREDQFNDVKDLRIKPSDLQRHFVAFANTDGGDLYVGVADPSVKGNRIQGFAKPEDANNHVGILLTQTKPSVDGAVIRFVDFGRDGLVLHVSVPKSPQVHYTADDRCFVRVNASTREIKADKITALAHAKGSYSYEKVAVAHVTPAEIASSPILKSYLERIGSALAPDQFLRKNRLVAESEGKLRPTVAAILLFDEEPQATLDSRCAIKVYRLQTTDPEYKREHLKETPATIEGSLESQINQVIALVDKLLQGVTVSVGGKLRPARYPAPALKELLVNAVIHRDYSLNDDIHVRIYDNRVEIQSPGRLPGYITKDNILDERYARNPNIVRCLHKLPDPPNFDIGEGLNTAYNLLREAGLVEPHIEELGNAVRVTVLHKRIASLTDIAKEYLQDNDTITNKVLRELSGEDSENKVKKALQKLREDGLIEPIDPGASAFKFEYRLTAAGRATLR